MDPLFLATAVGALTLGVGLGYALRPAPSEAAPRPQPSPPTAEDAAPPWPEGLTDGLVLVDAEGVIVARNDAARAMLGSCTNKPIGRFLPDWDTLESQRPDSRRAHNGEALGTQWATQLRDREDRTFQAVVGKLDHPRGTIYWIRDLADRAKALERLTQANGRLSDARDAAEAKNRDKTAYLARVAEALRTPLNTIVGYGELLSEELEDAGDAQTVSDLSKIIGAAGVAESILVNVLDLTEIEAGRMSTQRKPVQMLNLLQEVCHDHSKPAEDKGLVFRATVDPDIGAAIGDRDRVRQILYTLLDNALRYTKAGKIDLEARRHQVDGRDTVVITVQDSGPGMNQTTLSGLFMGLGSGSERSGVSLVLAHTFASLMEGSLEVQSTVGSGSLFTLKLRAMEQIMPPPMLFEEIADLPEDFGPEVPPIDEDEDDQHTVLR